MRAAAGFSNVEITPAPRPQECDAGKRRGIGPSLGEAAHSNGHSGAPIAILGVPFDNLTTAQTIALIESMVASRRPHYLVTPNVDFLVQAMRDVELRRILFEAHLVLCDGTPLVWASKLLGNPLAERVAGSDLVPLLIQVAAQRGYRVFFLGGSPESCELAAQRMRTQHPKLVIAGHYSPPFSNLLNMDHSEIRRRIADVKPDLLFVCFGCPKQEKWIAMHYQSLGVPVTMAVGGTIDFLAGRLARAPLWMRKAGLEWTFRLVQEPRRLFGRYVRDLAFFSWGLCAQWFRLQLRAPIRRRVRGRNSRLEPSNPTVVQDEWHTIRAPDWLDRQTVEENGHTWETEIASNPLSLVDLSGVRWIDSTGIGLLIRLQKRARSLRRTLVFLAPSLPVRKALHQMQLDSFFDFAPDQDAAQKYREAPAERDLVVVNSDRNRAHSVLAWQGEITAENAERAWQLTELYLRAQGVWRRELAIDLERLRFIDSSGAALMMRAKRAALQQDVRLRFEKVQPDVRNVLQLCRLDAFLLD